MRSRRIDANLPLIAEAAEKEPMRPCPSFPGYSVADDLTIVSYRRYPEGRTIKTHLWRGAYPKVVLSVNGKSKNVYVHALVADAFHGPRPPTLEVRHRDGNPENNTPGNICYGTHAENMQDRKRHLTLSGENHGRAKLNDEKVREIRRLARSGLRIKQIADTLGLSYQIVVPVFHGRYWKHVV